MPPRHARRRLWGTASQVYFLGGIFFVELSRGGLFFPGMRPHSAVHWRGEFRIPNCHEMALEWGCGADFWCSRHCKTSPVVLKGFWGQVWPNTGRKPAKNQNSELPTGGGELARGGHGGRADGRPRWAAESEGRARRGMAGGRNGKRDMRWGSPARLSLWKSSAQRMSHPRGACFLIDTARGERLAEKTLL